MSFPVKVPDEIYIRLKEQAEKEGIPIQEALVRLLTEPSRAVEALREELGKMRAALEERLAAREAEAQALNAALQALQQEVRALSSRKPELPAHAHPTYAERTAVETLQATLAQRQKEQEALASRVAALEARLREMEGVKARVEALEGRHHELVKALNSWVPTWQKIAVLEKDLAQLRAEHTVLTRHSDHQDRLLKEARDELARIQGKLGELEKRLAWVEAARHYHLGQRLQGRRG